MTPPPAPPAIRFLTPPMVAKRYGVDPSQVRQWIRSGALRAINVGNGHQRPRFRIDPADLTAFENSRQVSPPAKRPRRKPKDPMVIEFF